MTDEARAGEPRWDGESIDGRPVANCQECGALRYAEDIEYIGEAALGGPNFTYRLGELAAPSLDMLAQALHEVGGEFCDPFGGVVDRSHPVAMHNSQAAAIVAALSEKAP